VRPSSFKLFEKKALQLSPQLSEHDGALAGKRSQKPSVRGASLSSEKKPGKACQCEPYLKASLERLGALETKFEMMGLKLQEWSTQSSLDSTKQMETFTRLINLEKRCEKIEYSVWEMRELAKDERARHDDLREQLAKLGFDLGSEVRLLRDTVQGIQADFSQQELVNRVEAVKADQNRKLKNMYEALEEMGNLQASLVETVNTLKMPAREPRPAAQGKENSTKFNAVRLESHPTGWKVFEPRKNAYY
jgi:hypothetical protein